MTFMQFEFDVVPFLVGVGIFTFCQVLRWAFDPRKQAEKLQKLQKAALASGLVDESDEIEAASAQEPEPAPEPEDLEVEATPARRSSRLLCRSRVAVALLLALAGLLLRSRISEQFVLEAGLASLERSGVDKAVEQAVEQVVEPVVEKPVEEFQDSAKNAVATLEDSDMHGSEAPFHIKLTRQAMQTQNDDVVRSAYYGTLMVGTPGIEMTVVFDTGSGHVVLPSMYCKSDTCKAHTRYRRSKSETARDIDAKGNEWIAGPRESISVAFGTGDIEGVFIEDVLCLSDMISSGGSPSNTTLSQQNKMAASNPACTTLRLVAATEMSEDPFMRFNFDGILGLGLAGLSQAPEFNFMKVMSEDLVSRGLAGRRPQTFGVFLADSMGEDSEIALGGWASKHIREDLSWSSLFDPEQGHWIVPIRRIRIDDEIVSFCEDGTCKAAMDTGTSLLSMPTNAFRGIYESLRHQPSLAGHCRGHGPLLHIELEQTTLSLGPKDYSEPRRTRRTLKTKFAAKSKGTPLRADLRCLPMLMTLDLDEPIGPKLFILGEPVLRKYYTVYDGQQLRVGIGRAKHTLGPNREQLLNMAPEVEPVASHRLPNMFDIFRWRKALK